MPGHGTIAGRILTPDGRHLPNAPSSSTPGQTSTPPLLRHTYEDALGLIFPDDEWGENFLLADLPAGAYKVEVSINGKVYFLMSWSSRARLHGSRCEPNR